MLRTGERVIDPHAPQPGLAARTAAQCSCTSRSTLQATTSAGIPEAVRHMAPGLRASAKVQTAAHSATPILAPNRAANFGPDLDRKGVQILGVPNYAPRSVPPLAPNCVLPMTKPVPKRDSPDFVQDPVHVLRGVHPGVGGVHEIPGHDSNLHH